MNIAKEQEHTEVYRQTLQRAVAQGVDIRLARLEASGAEKAAREAEKRRKRAEKKAKEKQTRISGNAVSQKRISPQERLATEDLYEKGQEAPVRVKLFAEVRQGEDRQTAVLEKLNQVRAQPLYHRDLLAELTPAQKKYLLTLYQLDSSIVAQVDIANQLGVTKASTHKVIHDLIGLGLVERYDRCSIALPEKGLLAAVNLYDCCSVIVADLLRYLPPEKFCQQRQGALEAVLKMPLELVQELLHSLEEVKMKNEKMKNEKMDVC